MIFGNCCAVLVAKKMLVVPEAVGASELSVDEPVGRLPGGNFTLPAYRHAVDMKSVIDFDSLAHLDGAWRENVKAEPRRSESLQIVGVREEGKDVMNRPGQPDGTLVLETCHDAWRIAGARIGLRARTLSK